MGFATNVARVVGDVARHPLADTDRQLHMAAMYVHVAGGGDIKQGKTDLFGPGQRSGTNAAAPEPVPEAGSADEAAPEEEAPLKAAVSGEVISVPLSTFKMILWFFFVLTAGCLIANVALAFSVNGPYSDAQTNAAGLLDWGFKTGLGAVVGVISGKAASLS